MSEFVGPGYTEPIAAAESPGEQTAPALPAALPKVLRDREELFCRALAASGLDPRDTQAVVTAYNAMRDADPSLDHPAELEQARPAPADCRHEPPYPGADTVTVSFAHPDHVAHLPSERCGIEEPHEIEHCGEFARPSPSPPESWREVVEQAIYAALETHFGHVWQTGEKMKRIPAAARDAATAVLRALAGVELAAAASEARLRTALERRAVEVLTRMDGDRVGWRSYECSLCGGTWENDEGPGHDASCPLAAQPSPTAEVLAELMALPDNLDDLAAPQQEKDDPFWRGHADGLHRAGDELRAALCRIGVT
jgi:hypothetical protein